MMKNDFVPLGHEARLRHKHEIGGMLDDQEALFNKKLLQEIADRKRNRTLVSQNTSPDR